MAPTATSLTNAERKWRNFGARAARINLALNAALSADESVNTLICEGYARELAKIGKPKEKILTPCAPPSLRPVDGGKRP